MITKMLARFIVLFCCFVTLTAWGFPVGSLYVFGDSLSDNGNAAFLTGGAFPPSPPYYMGRFSNGPVAVEVLAARLGVSLTPSLFGGTDYAVGGATTGAANFDGLTGVPLLQNTGIAQQIAQFTAAPPAFNPSTSLFVVWGGPNDFNLAAAFGQPLPNVIPVALTNLGNDISTLAAFGAQHVLVPNMPDLGATPFAASSGQQAGLTALTQAFNSNLANELSGLQGALGIDIIPFDTFGAMHNVLNNPGAFGFTNTTDPCLTLQPLSVCADPNSFFFWDDEHPTAHTHQILADGFLMAVQEPASILLLLAGLAALTWARGRTTSLAFA